MRLLEVVLYSPVEAVLGPWVARANTEETKKWLNTNFRNWLVKSPDNLHKLPYLPVNATEKQKKAFSFDDLYDIRLTPQTQTELEHIMDFFDNNQDIPRLERMSVENVLQAADLWVKQMHAQAKKQPDDPKQVKTVMTFAGGYRMVDLIGQNALAKEGALMGHCVGGASYCDFINRGEGKIYSLRDGSNEPHATIQVMADNSTAQIKGRGNAAPTRKYWPMLRDFFEKYGVRVANDHHNIGLLRIYNQSTGDYTTLTQDQFKDMILDPNNAEGQEILNNYATSGVSGRHNRGMFDNDEQDMSMGLFVALYGTERMTPSLVHKAFQSMPEHAVQVIEHYGNKLTPDMLVDAFTAIKGHRQETISALFKRMLIITKPDVATIRRIIDGLSDESGIRHRHAASDDTFVTALAQVMPQVYQSMLLDEDGAIQKELDTRNDRAAGPFFVFVGTDLAKQVDPELIPEMINRAFAYMADDAIKRIKKLGYVMHHDEVIAAFVGMGSHYWASAQSEYDKALEQLIDYVKPDGATLREAFEDTHSSDYKAKLLILARKHVPDSLDQPTVEEALIGIDKDEMFQSYLKEEPNPGLKFQQELWNKDRRKNENNRMQWIQNIDPSIFRSALELLRPTAVETSKDDYKMVKDKSANARPGTQKQIKFKRNLTPEELTKAQWEHRKKVIKSFSAALAPMLREPDAHGNSDLDPESPKFKDGQKAFAAMGKSKLFDVAVKYINRKSLKSRIQSGSNRGFGMHDGMTFRDAKDEFVEKLGRLHVRDIVQLIDSVGYNKELFAVLINHAPQMIPIVMANQKLRGSYASHGIQWEKLDWPGLDKEKTFEALEAVWASDKIPEGYVDDFTLKVFKRFKPSPAKLLEMLEKADSEEATRYVLKKTKKPKADLLKFVAEGFPQLLAELVPLESIPDAFLVDLFKNDWQDAFALMERDLRGFGKDDTRRKYSRATYHRSINPDSPAYARYEAAAKKAGKATEFERYVKASWLADSKQGLLRGGVRDNQAKSVDIAKLTADLDDYGLNTLVEFAQYDEAGQVIPLYFSHFGEKKLANLVLSGMFDEPYRGYQMPPKNKGILAKVDPTKLNDVATMLIKHDKDGAKLLTQMRGDGVPISNDLMKAFLLSNKSSDKGNFVNDSMDDEMKDFVADHIPYMMDHFRHPTAYVVARLFDEYGKVDKDGRVNHNFGDAFNKWFKSGEYFFEYRPNPAAEKLVKAEAMRRKGVAAQITLAMFRNLHATIKKKEASSYVSLASSPKIAMVVHKKHVDPEDNTSSIYAPDEE